MLNKNTTSEYFRFGNHTDVGKVRTANEDYYGTFETPSGYLFIVCDGMGGHKGGFVASRLAVETIKDYVMNATESDPIQLLQNAIQSANQAVLTEASNHPELRGMGTTCVMLLIRKENDRVLGWRAHIGDSRMYLIRNQQIELLTQDHSRVMEMVRHGIITKEEAEHHPDRNIITRAIGVSEIARPDVEKLELYQNDRLILCTDGVSGPVKENEILNYSNDLKPQILAEMLVAKANERGGEDNATVQVIDILVGPKAPKQKRGDTQEKKWYQKSLIIVVPAIALIILLVGLWMVNEKVRILNQPKVNEKKQTEITSKDTTQQNQKTDIKQDSQEKQDEKTKSDTNRTNSAKNDTSKAIEKNRSNHKNNPTEANKQSKTSKTNEGKPKQSR